jgi:hypothetical protein
LSQWPAVGRRLLCACVISSLINTRPMWLISRLIG